MKNLKKWIVKKLFGMYLLSAEEYKAIKGAVVRETLNNVHKEINIWYKHYNGLSKSREGAHITEDRLIQLKQNVEEKLIKSLKRL